MRIQTRSLLFVGLALLSLACGGSGEDSAVEPSAGGAGGSAGNAGAAGVGNSGGAAGNSGGAGGAGGAGAGGADAGGAAGGAGEGAGGTLIGLGGQGGCGTTACTDCVDNDGDGLIDGFDPECTGYLDNDEGTFATGIQGDNVDACKQDCFFDGNSGQGDDGCTWDLACDPLNPGGNLAKACPYDPNKQNCPGPPSQKCLDSCMKNVPNGCDCFGCCAFQTASGPKAVLLLPGCSYDKINDPLVCPPCTQAKECNNPCEPCEFCLGKTELPPECNGAGGAAGQAGAGGAGGAAGQAGSAGAAGSPGGAGGSGPLPQCSAGVQACTPTSPCPSGYYCLTGCCQVIINLPAVRLPLLLLLATLAGCAAPAPPPAQRGAPPAAPPAARRPAAPAPPSRAFARTAAAESSCQAIEASSRQALDRALSASEELQGDPVPDLSATPRGCLDRSPWAVVIETASSAPCQGGSCATLRWHVAHVAPSGRVTPGPPHQDLVGGHPLRLLQVVTHDWDGDGEPELFLRRSRAFLACGREAAATDDRADVWTFRVDEVRRHDAALRMSGEVGPLAVQDENGDGRPDLRVEGPFRAVVGLACGAPGGAVVLAGPPWLALAQPGGGFSLEDAAAQTAHRKECPAPPAALVVPSGKEGFALAATARNVACARAWGESTEKLRGELEAGRGQLCRGEPGPCAALEELKRWAGLAPPVRLR